MVAHIVVASLEDSEEAPVAGRLIAVEHRLERLRLVPSPIDEGAVALTLVLQVMLEESVEHPLARRLVELLQRLHLDEVPHGAVAQPRLLSVDCGGYPQVRLLRQVVHILLLVHRFECPRCRQVGLHEQVVFGGEISAGIDISERHGSIVESEHRPLLCRHLRLRPHHHGRVGVTCRIFHEERSTAVGIRYDAVGFARLYSGRGHDGQCGEQ